MRNDSTQPQPSQVAKMSASEFADLCNKELPISQFLDMRVDSFNTDRVDLRAVYSDDMLRPGGTLSGPVMMTLADAAMFGVILANLGPVVLAVTTNLSIDFLRKPPPDDVIASARLLKLGKRLAVGDIMITSAQTNKLVARASATYSLPVGG